MLDQYNARKEASHGATRADTLRMENLNSKGKSNTEDDESFNETPRDVDWKLVHALQRFLEVVER